MESGEGFQTPPAGAQPQPVDPGMAVLQMIQAMQQQAAEDCQTAQLQTQQQMLMMQQAMQQQELRMQEALKGMATSKSPDKVSKSEQRKTFLDLEKFKGKDWKEWRYDFRSAAG